MTPQRKRILLFSGNTYYLAAKALVDSHIIRVNADGGVFPTSNYTATVNYVYSAMLAYGTTNLSSVLPLWVSPNYFGYKVGTGSGVTANGYAAATLYSLLGSSGDFTQGTPGNQPLLLPYSGINYWWNGGVAGNACSTPDNSNNQLRTDFTIDAYFNLTITSANGIFSKATSSASNYGLRFQISSSAVPQLFLSTDGTTATTYNCTTAATKNYLRVTRNSSTGDIKFYDSNDGVSWSQLGTTISGVTGALYSSTAQAVVGAVYDYFTNAITGALNWVKIYKDSTASTVTQIFNPASYSASTSQTTWTSATGETWTINKSSTAASATYRGELVYKTLIQSDGTNDNLAISSFTTTQPYTEYAVIERLVSGNLIAKATGNSLSHNGTATFTLNNGSSLTFTNSTRNVQLITARNNGASSGLASNNGTETTGAAGSGNGTNITLLGGSYSLFNYLISNANDNSTVRASIYSILSQMNGNAF